MRIIFSNPKDEKQFMELVKHELAKDARYRPLNRPRLSLEQVAFAKAWLDRYEGKRPA